mmetsp:Transcript_174150/g.558424  ORF Transcript_174150/g.558424 Transcript_174150/m.558424 type:complete len:319 (-) Transcript_174150:2089-3045(-)
MGMGDRSEGTEGTKANSERVPSAPLGARGSECGTLRPGSSGGGGSGGALRSRLGMGARSSGVGDHSERVDARCGPGNAGSAAGSAAASALRKSSTKGADSGDKGTNLATGSSPPAESTAAAATAARREVARRRSSTSSSLWRSSVLGRRWVPGLAGGRSPAAGRATPGARGEGVDGASCPKHAATGRSARSRCNSASSSPILLSIWPSSSPTASTTSSTGPEASSPRAAPSVAKPPAAAEQLPEEPSSTKRPAALSTSGCFRREPPAKRKESACCFTAVRTTSKSSFLKHVEACCRARPSCCTAVSTTPLSPCKLSAA